MRLTSQQRNLLWSASSKNVENKNLSPLAIARKIDAVVAQLHRENGLAFLTTVHEDANGETYFKGIEGLLKEREFYNQPTHLNMNSYKSFVKPHKNFYDYA